jgi:hypothetical protein
MGSKEKISKLDGTMFNLCTFYLVPIRIGHVELKFSNLIHTFIRFRVCGHIKTYL